jgi:hypothetical protein
VVETDIPSQVLAQFVIISAIVIITSYYLSSISSYTSFLREKELEVAAYKIERQIIEAINEAMKSKSKIVVNATIGSPYRGKIIYDEAKECYNLSLSEGDMTKNIPLPKTIGIGENAIRIKYELTSFTAYEVMIIVDYDEKNNVVNIWLS